jgi:hypothetical protein
VRLNHQRLVQMGVFLLLVTSLDFTSLRFTSPSLDPRCTTTFSSTGFSVQDPRTRRWMEYFVSWVRGHWAGCRHSVLTDMTCKIGAVIETSALDTVYRMVTSEKH